MSVEQGERIATGPVPELRLFGGGTCSPVRRCMRIMNQLDRLVPLAVITVAVIVFFAALDSAESILAPIVLGIVTGIVLSPLSDLWDRWGFRPAIGALVSLILALSVVGALIMVLQPIVARLVAQAPKVLADMQETIDSITTMMRGLRNATEVVAEAISAEPGTQAAATAEAAGLPTVTDAILLAPSIVAQATIFAGVLFFFLMTRHELYGAIARTIRTDTEPMQIVARLMRAERHVSRYFLTVSMINAVLGLFTAAALHLLGLPDGILWGLVAALFNFLVYLGPVIVSLALLVAGVAAFDGAMSVAPAAAYTMLNFIESQFVTPSFVGRQMEVNPLVVFCALVFGMWLWGAIGGIVALPIAIWAKVMHDERRLSTHRLPDSAVAAATASPQAASARGKSENQTRK